MRKLFLLFLLTGVILSTTLSSVHGQATDSKPETNTPVVACQGGGCPPELSRVYQERGEACVTTLEEFNQDPAHLHFWIEDPEVTAQGKADERSRQFISWVLSKSAIDEHPTLKIIWNTTRNIAYFLVILVAAVIGIGFIVGQRANFELKVKVWPSILKIAGALVYITFSAAIVLFLIQLSEILMKFFIENLGADKIFNIYFSGTTSQEKNYVDFIGCRDVNIRVQESATTALFMLKVTNVIYYILGIMLLLRKILLWFLLFVSPFIAILFPFVFVRNIGWTWIGVFFQWLFYGPLVALFLGALATIWKNGIPFPFDFTRSHLTDASGYVYPTAINILYGGPAQVGANQLHPLNNGNYVDTFAEYVITLIMLTAVIFFPWWLLRIFRDYCCDGIYAMKNILLSLYDQMRSGPPNPPLSGGPGPTRSPTFISTPQSIDQQVTHKIETIEEIKKSHTEEITRSLNISAPKLTDIARFETNKQTHEVVKRNLDYLANPMKAQTPAERQKYMNIRTELFNRSGKQDVLAKQILSATATSSVEKLESRAQILQSTPQTSPVSQTVSVKVQLPQDKIASITSAVTTSVSASNTMVNAVAGTTHVPAEQIHSILKSYKFNIAKPSSQVVTAIAKETETSQEKVKEVIKNVFQTITKEVIKETALKEQVTQEQVEKVIQAQIPIIAEPEKNIEQTIAIPPSISIEDYEEVKKMWAQQYERGEVPVTENVATRDQWIDQDIVLITNTLNKLLSADEPLRLQALDEVGYLLPIFIVNNMKGGELSVYLKAKLEAAKATKSQLEREKDITEKLRTKAEETFVDVAATKKEEAAKTMSMAEELSIDQDLHAMDDKKENPPTK